MLRFASLGSGSKGNGTLIESGKTRILVDCGFGLADSERRLQRLGCSPQSLAAILITHEHGDHANGAGKLSRRYDIPVYTTVGTYHSIKDRRFSRTQYITPNQAAFELDDIHVMPFPVPHDAREPCQFVFSDGVHKLGLLTDTGSYTPFIVQMLKQLDALLLECNYDAQMLAAGRYPPSLKKRVGGDYGHLDNRQSASLLKQLDHHKLQHLVGMHLSENNNHPDHAKKALCDGLGCEESWISLANQESGFDWRELR